MRNHLKTLSLITLLAIMLFTFSSCANALEPELTKQYVVKVDGKEVQFNNDLGFPKNINGRTLVPIRVISEDMGYKVDWSEDTWANGIRKVWISNSDISIELEIDKTTAIVNGKKVSLDTKVPTTKAQLIGSRTYVPLRFIAENMNCTVHYEEKDDIGYIYITRPDGETPTDPEEPSTPEIPDVGTIPGTATYDHQKDFPKIEKFFGEDADKNLSGIGDTWGLISFNPIGTYTDMNFFTVAYNEDLNGIKDCEVEIAIKLWYNPETDSEFPLADKMAKINPTVKEILRFYLPKGYDKLYTIIDDGYKGKLGNKAKNLTNRNIQSEIGSEKRVIIVDSDGALLIRIGEK